MEKITITIKWDELEFDCEWIADNTVLTMLGTATSSYITRIAKDKKSALSLFAMIRDHIEKEIQEDME